MIKARVFVASMALLLAALPIAAQGKANSLTPVDGLDNWKYGLDLGNYAPGKYNLVVEGKDKAGNVTRATPMNIYIDPKSDLPIVSIINPISLMRIGGDLNIVGTCAAAKGVDRVEISLDGAAYVKAEGGEFWSFFLKTTAIPEGRRTIDVRGIDVNGLVGPSVRVKFDLDRTKPVAAVDSPVVGSLVSGQIRLSGTVFDANGVRSLEISQDGGKSWIKLALKKGKDPLTLSFAWPVDTKKLSDGPKVFSLRSVDMVGSTSTAAYLVFVDNTKPSIEIARPAAGKAVNGVFSIVGAVRDIVGVKRLSYEVVSGEKGEIALTKGDPFFVKEIDASKLKGDSATVTLVAEDTIGNLTRLTKAYKIDRKADKPVLKVLGPLAGAAASPVLKDGDPIWGSIADDDGVAAVRWSFDGGTPVEAACSEVFSLVPPPAASGKHLLSLVPVDVNGISGDAVLFPFVLDKGPGAVTFDRITSAKASRDFAQGAQTSVDAGEFLEGAAASLNPLVSAECSIAGGQSKPVALVKGAAAGTWRFRIALDRSLPYGFAPITLRIKDAAGKFTEAAALLYVTDYGIAREEPGFRFSDPRVGADGRVVFGPKGAGLSSPVDSAPPLLGAFYGGELSALRFDPPTDLVTASYEGRAVSIAAAKDGTSAPTRLLGKTSKGREFSAGPFVFVTDSTPPTLTIDSPAEGSSFNAKTLVAGKATDSAGAVTLSWRRLPDGESTKAAVKNDGSFSIALSAADLPAGPLSIEIEAKDEGGNSARAYRNLGAATAPAVRFLSPEAGAAVWGAEDVAAAIDSASGIASVEYAADGKSFSAIEWKGRYFVHRADLAGNPKAAYRIVDNAGNVILSRPDVVVGAPPSRIAAAGDLSVEPSAGEARIELAGTAGISKASLLLPGLSEADFGALGDTGAPPPARFAVRLLVPGTLSLKGQATVDGQAKAVSLSVDGGATYRLLASNKDAKSAKAVIPFSFAVEAAKLQNGAARWAIKVEDFAGESYFCPLFCLVDTKAPSLAVINPEKGTTAMSGPFPLIVKAEDENGLASGELVNGAGSGAAKESLDIEAGGRYFARMLDMSPASVKAAPQAIAIGVTVKDIAGNQAALALKYGYAAGAATPKIRLDSPVVDAKGLIAPLEAGSLISGSAAGSEGPAPIRVSIDGGDALSFPAGTFAFALPELKAGKHNLSLEAGEAGTGLARLTKAFSVKGVDPALGDFKIGSGKGSAPWAPGADFALGASSLVSGSVAAPNGLSSVSVSVNGGPPVQAALGKASMPGTAAFSASLPASLPYDRVLIELSAKDLNGQIGVARLELHKILAAAASDDDEGLRFVDSRIVDAGGRPSLPLAPGDKIVGRFNGRPIKSVAIKPATPALAASFDGSSVAIEGKAEGLAASAEFTVVTVDGDIFSWGPFSAAVGAGAPALEVTSPSDNDWVRGEVALLGKATDLEGIVLLQVSVNGGEAVSLYDAAAAKDKKAAAIDKTLSLAAAADGATRLDFLARDGGGRETRVMRFINKDTLPPTLTQIEPAIGESVNGLTTFVGEASDGGRLASVVFVPAEGIKAEDASGLGTFSRDLDLARLDMPLPEGGGFVVTDKAGNKAVLVPTVVVDKEKDKPVVTIQAPVEMEVLRGDFAVSGVAYDDDGLAAAYYRVDGGAWNRLEMQGTSFSVPFALKDTTDNEHLVEVKAEDIYGVQGDIVSRKYRISKEEPSATMSSPPISKPVRGTVKLVGTASDANGIKEITISVDNRTSYDRPVGKENWSLSLDTTTLSDGIHAVAVRPIDGYDTEGFYATMVYVDNTPPKAQLDLPRDGDAAAGTLAVSGRVSDNIAIASSRIEISPVGAAVPPQLVLDLGTDKIVQRVVDLSSLKPGAYTVRLIVRDGADNETLASRDITVVGGLPVDTVSIVFPVEGERPAGRLRVQGQERVASGAGTVSILSDGSVLGAAEPDELGWYSLDVPADALADGLHVLKARTSAKDGRTVESPETRIEWSSLGPWVSIDSFPSGKYLPYRPYLRGGAGWAANPPPTDKKDLEAYKKEAKSKEVTAVELSLDDGRTFEPVKGTSRWSIRLETQDYKEGALRVIVRARYADGSTAAVKSIYFLDKTPPVVEVLTPSEGGRFNGVLALSGIAHDQNGMASVGVALRKGDKASYEVPSFIQGLYIDGQMLGATTWQAGIGLTFFGDNVKLQGNYGQAPTTDSAGNPQSFYGDVFGAKLIANLLYLPFDSIFGPDWRFLSTSLGVGANFTYFTKTQSGNGLLIGSVFGQLEFPKLTMSGSGAFKKFSLYAEYELWVLSSVVNGGFIPKISFGARIGVF
jgi:hypothetical protein